MIKVDSELKKKLRSSLEDMLPRPGHFRHEIFNLNHMNFLARVYLAGKDVRDPLKKDVERWGNPLTYFQAYVEIYNDFAEDVNKILAQKGSEKRLDSISFSNMEKVENMMEKIIAGNLDALTKGELLEAQEVYSGWFEYIKSKSFPLKDPKTSRHYLTSPKVEINALSNID